MLARILLLFFFGMLMAGTASARVLGMKIAKLTTEVAQLEGVSLRLEWPEGAAEGQLQLQINRLDAENLGYQFDHLRWSCQLRQTTNNGWACAGQVHAGNHPPLHLALQMDDVRTRAELAQGAQRLGFSMQASAPDIYRIDLQQIPLKWLETWLAQMLEGAEVSEGQASGQINVLASAGVQVKAELELAGVGFQNGDGSTVVAGLAGQVGFDYRELAARAEVDVRADFSAEALLGSQYLALTERPVHLTLQMRQDEVGIWQVPNFSWQDTGVLKANGAARLGAGGELAQLSLSAQSADISSLPTRYLGGALGQLGLGKIQMQGALQLQLDTAQQGLQRLNLQLDGVDVHDPERRFGFAKLSGDVALSAAENVNSSLGWQRAEVLGLVFDPARFDFRSSQGVLGLRKNTVLPIFDGRIELHDLHLKPAGAEGSMQISFGLDLQQIDIGKMSKGLGLPDFRGELNGEIPRVVYANDRIDFDGGLSIGFFEGAMQITELSMERPFGTAPTLSADIDFNDLDLLRLTEVFGFGSITGRLDGHVHGLRLVDWQPVRFDARFVTDRKPGVRQRISQRAVQNISSVGDASFMNSLQNRLISLFDDFGYARIGISCRLENEVCLMGGLEDAATDDSANNGFTIVKGSSLPRLDVIGHNRRVNWPTLLERLKAASSGEIEPVID